MAQIPDLELDFGDAQQCGSPPGSNDLAAGLSRMPVDTIVAGKLCKDQKGDDNLCLVYAGGMIAYYDATSTTSNTTAVKATRLGVSEAGTSMKNDDFLYAHYDLERVSFIEGAKILRGMA